MAKQNPAWSGILLLTALLTAFSAAGKSVYAQGVEEIVSAVEGHYGTVNEFSAKVTQTNHLKAVGKTLKFEGTLRVKKPGRLRLDYSNGQIILVDGRTAMFYSKKSEQLVKKTFADVQQMNIPVAFLLGAAHLRDDFDVLQPDPNAPRSLDLIPKRPGASMKKLVLRTDDAGRVTDLTIFDKSGNTTEVSLTDVREGATVDDRIFSFKPPKGTEIIEQ